MLGLKEGAIISVILISPVLLSGRVLDFDSSHQIFHFHGVDTTSRIGSYLKGLGDINGDGYDDIAFNSWSPAGTYVFLGGNTGDSIPDYFLNGNAAIGDFLDYDGDSLPDLITSWADPTSGSNGVIYFNRGHGDFIESQPADSMVMPLGFNGFWLRASSDHNHNLIADILILAINPSASRQLCLYNDPFASDKLADWIYIINPTHTVRHSGFIDFDGDGEKDIFSSMVANSDTLSYVYLFLGPSFGEEPDIVIGYPVELDTLDVERFAEGVYNIGDVNADGWDDLGVNFNSAPLIYLCGPGADTIYDYNLQARCQNIAGAGDINGDGHNDLVIGAAEIYDGHLAVFLAGPLFDLIRDDEIFRSDLPPLFLDDIGWKVTSAGDFNGDGYDDILFSCQNFAHGEPWDVFIFSGGSDITVGVAEGNNMEIPEGFRLYQNYPNPFNQSTVITFDIPRRSLVSLSIYNILGQRIANIIENQLLDPGEHKYTWDGKLSNGLSAPSGVYYYQLTNHSSCRSSKMILLK
jgi:hypothetical protein